MNSRFVRSAGLAEDRGVSTTRFGKTAACLMGGLLATGCQTVDFYKQAIQGQAEIVRKSRPNGEVLADPGSGAELKRQLLAVEDIRRFASDHLGLPGDESYGKYADLGREMVSWVLYAAPEFSLEPKRWWYPTLGRLDYRGYFKREDAIALGRELKAERHDVYVGGVEAYSTLGWLHDPVLNTFVKADDADLAELIFHELTHRKIFRNGDTPFNESLANAVGEEGVRRWLRQQGRLADLRHYEGRLVRRKQFYDRIEWTREKLKTLYASGVPEETMRRRKAELFKELQDNFRELRRRWGGRGLESWLEADLNNAHLVAVITYHRHVPVFEKLLKESGGDLDTFFKKAGDIRLDEPDGEGAEE